MKINEITIKMIVLPIAGFRLSKWFIFPIFNLPLNNFLAFETNFTDAHAI